MAEATQEHSTTHPRFMPAVQLEHLWVVMALSMVGVLISLSPTSPIDFWWHLKVGELIATSGIPVTNIFAWTLPANTPFVYQSWLGEWLFYAVYWLGGLKFVVFVRNMLGLGAFTLVAVQAYQRSGSWRLAGGAALLAMLMTINNLSTRTQNWSWIPFALVVLLLTRYASQRLAPRWLLVLPLLMVFWVNAHGAFIMGLLVAGAFVVGETLRRLLRQPYALNWEQLRWLYSAAVAMAGATILNPLGIGVYGYVHKLLTDPPSQLLVIEWKPPTSDTLAGFFFYVSVLALIVAFAFARRRPTITDVLLVCGLLWMAFDGVRYVVWFGIAAMPVVAQCLAKPRRVIVPSGDDAARRPLVRRPKGSSLANLSMVLVLALAVVALQPWFKPLLPLPQAYHNFFAPVPGAPLLFTADTPVAATEYLRDAPCAGELFNEMGYGSYLIWSLYPEAKVFADPRVELFPLELWQDYLSLSRGQQVEALLARYTIACVLLDRDNQPNLSAVLATLPGWQRTYNDAQSEVWRRVQDA